jgi:hypothetical protein
MATTSRTAIITERPSWDITAPFSLKGAVGEEAVREWGLASDLLGEQSPANSLFVILAPEGALPRIATAHTLELGEMVHGLFSFAEVGFTDEEVMEYFELQETVEKMQMATADARTALADGVAEMARQRTTLAFLSSNTLAAGFRQLQVRRFIADLEKLRCNLDRCIAIQEAMETVITETRANALAAITAHYRPTRFPLTVGTFLRLRAKNE